MAKSSRRGLRAALLVCAALLVLIAVGVWSYGSMAIEPTQRPVAAPPASLRAERAMLFRDGAPDLAGWLVPQQGPLCGVAIVLHGRGAARDRMLGRITLLAQAGIAVAAFDFQGHGQSGGAIKGFGYREADDALRIAEAARAFRPGAKLGVLGVSLGAAAATMAAEDLDASAYVLEALYATLIETTAMRTPLPYLRELQARLLHLQTPIRLGYFASDLRPVDRLAGIDAPILLLAGGHDPWATPEQTEALKAAAGAKAQLVWFPEAGHQDFLRHDPETYSAAVIPFLRRALCGDAPS